MSVSGFVIVLLRTMKGNLNCFFHSVSGVIVSRTRTKNESQSMCSTLINGCLVVSDQGARR